LKITQYSAKTSHMTPIRVRGKKQNASGKLQKAIHRSTPKGSPNPTMSEPVRELSLLERLPTELLQHIFLQSLNLNLPRASPILNSALSGPHVKMLLVFKVFSSDSSRALEHSTELLNILDTKQEIAKLQTAILRLKWMTLDFLHQCIRVFLVKTLLRRFRELELNWRTGDKPTEATVTQVLEEAYERNSLGFGDEFLDLHSYTWDVSNQIRVVLGIGLRDGLITLQVYTSKDGPNLRAINSYRWRLLVCLGECRIPDKLLHGPWTDARCDFLDVVTRGGSSVDWVNTTSGEVADVGLKEALLEQNYRAVQLLVQNPWRGTAPWHDLDHLSRPNERSYRERRPNTKVPYKKRQVCCKKSIEWHVGVAPRIEHLRIAVIQKALHQGIVHCLLSGDRSKLDLEDKEIHEWIRQNEHAEEKNAGWLRREIFHFATLQDSEDSAGGDTPNDLFSPSSSTSSDDDTGSTEEEGSCA